MQKAISISKKYWPLALIALCAFLLRVYKLEELFYFTYDESIPAFVARRMQMLGHIPLIGGVTPFGVHITPYFYYFLSLILILGNLNPIIWGFFGALFSIVTTAGIFVLASLESNKKIAITASIIWALSFVLNAYDRHLWALYPGPLISIAVLYSLYKLIKGKNNFNYLLTIALIFGVSADPSNLIFLFFSVFIYYLFKIPITKSTKIGIVIFIISLAPLLIFDLRHNFANTKPFFEYWGRGNNNPAFNINRIVENIIIFPRTMSRILYPTGGEEIANQYTYSKQIILTKYKTLPGILVLSSGVILIWFIYSSLKNKKNTLSLLISLLISFYLAGIFVYGSVLKGDIFEHYLTGLFVSFILVISRIGTFLNYKLLVSIIAIFMAINLNFLSKANSGHGLKNKRLAIEYTMQQAGNNKFSLDSLSSVWRLSGYRYLFSVYGREPVKSYVDPNFGYLYGNTKISLMHPNIVAAFVIHGENEKHKFYQRYSLLKSYEISSKIFGNIEVIIMDNSDNWLD